MVGENYKAETNGLNYPIQKKSKREFSKIILVFAGLVNLFVIVFTCFMVYITKDLTPLAYLIPATAAEVGTGTAFYYNKAKLENKIKLMAIYGVEPKTGDFDADSQSPSSGMSFDYSAQG
jgi:hypothetical protein